MKDREVVRRDGVLHGVRRIAGFADREEVESIVVNQVVDQRSFVDGAAVIPGRDAPKFVFGRIFGRIMHYSVIFVFGEYCPPVAEYHSE